MLDAGYRIPDAGYRIPDTGYRIPDTGYRMLDSLSWMVPQNAACIAHSAMNI
jgi:hypothetical protein